MKKSISCMIISFLFLAFITTVKAETCSDEEKARLKKEAAKVKMVYEEAEGVESSGVIPELGDEIHEVKYNYFKISLSNVTSELYVIIKNNSNSDKLQVSYNDTENGLYTFDWINIDEVVNFTYEISGSYDSPCFGEQLSVGYLTTPKYNVLHDLVICEGLNDLSACDKYIKENVEQEVLEKRIKEYIEKNKKLEDKDKSFVGKVVSLIKKHKILFAGGVIIIIGSGVALVIYKKKKESDLI